MSGRDRQTNLLYLNSIRLQLPGVRLGLLALGL